MNTKQTPHNYRRDSVTFWIALPALILIIALIIMSASCTGSRKAQDPCKERRGMSGYGYGWIKCLETGKVCILAPDGAIIYAYYERSI
jgi:hypothetical protein